MSILIKDLPLAGYEISIMKDGERYRARVDGIWCEVEEIPTTEEDSDTISRQQAIEALKNDMASLDHIIKGMSANDVRLDAYVSQRNQVNYDIYTINNLPPALGTNLAEVGTDCISRQDAIALWDKYHHTIATNAIEYDAELRKLPPVQPERVWSELDKQLIDALLRKIYELQGTSLSVDGVVAKKYYIEELYGVLFGRGEKPKWMT